MAPLSDRRQDGPPSATHPTKHWPHSEHHPPNRSAVPITPAGPKQARTNHGNLMPIPSRTCCTLNLKSAIGTAAAHWPAPTAPLPTELNGPAVQHQLNSLVLKLICIASTSLPWLRSVLLRIRRTVPFRSSESASQLSREPAAPHGTYFTAQTPFDVSPGNLSSDPSQLAGIYETSGLTPPDLTAKLRGNRP